MLLTVSLVRIGEVNTLPERQALDHVRACPGCSGKLAEGECRLVIARGVLTFLLGSSFSVIRSKVICAFTILMNI
jgi:hypothetical protein